MNARPLPRVNRPCGVKASIKDFCAAALEAAGVEFIAENGSGAGVRLKK